MLSFFVINGNLYRTVFAGFRCLSVYIKALYIYTLKSNRVAMIRKWGNHNQIPLLKTKWEKIKNTNRQKTRRTNGQPSRQLFPKRWLLSNPNQTKSMINKHKVKHHRNSDTKTGNGEPHKNHRFGTVSKDILGGLNIFYWPNLTLRN